MGRLKKVPKRSGLREAQSAGLEVRLAQARMPASTDPYCLSRKIALSAAGTTVTACLSPTVVTGFVAGTQLGEPIAVVSRAKPIGFVGQEISRLLPSRLISKAGIGVRLSARFMTPEAPGEILTEKSCFAES